MAKAVAVRGMCPGCGHVFEDEAKEGSHRRIVECPSCREHKIIAREVGGPSKPAPTPTADNERPKRRSSVRKVTYKPRATEQKPVRSEAIPEGIERAPTRTRNNDGRFAARQSTEKRDTSKPKLSAKPPVETQQDLCSSGRCHHFYNHIY